MGKQKRLVFLVFAIASVIVVLSLVLALHHDRNKANEWDSIEADFHKHEMFFKEYVASVKSEFEVITKTTYDKTNSNLAFIFEELGYRAIRIDGHGNIFFDKYGDGLSFKGLVYSTRIDNLLIPKAKLIKTLDMDSSWHLYSEYFL